ncbi:MAG: AraC family transcriptional regulator [Gemmobacter sp.]|nr:AraC family transcriptional regulator [Gemmobacter sp.]
MIAIPLPFVLALLLFVLLGFMLARQGDESRRIAGFLGLCIVLLVLVGLRWTFDLAVLRFLQPVVAALVPPAAWICFAPLRGGRSLPVWLHLAPALGVLICSALWPWVGLPVDGLLAALFLGYGVSLLRLGLRGADGLLNARLTSAASAGQAGTLAGGILVFSGLVDAAIALDFGFGDGSHAANLVSAGNLLMLPLIGAILVRLAGSAPGVEAAAPTEAEPPAPPAASLEDALVLERIDHLLTERHLYRDPDLTLERLARRVGIPARQVSGAINRKLGRNVSQVINEWRIREAMQLLDDTEAPVTQIMFDCGFQTKSNFNREFRRVAGASPSEWRDRPRNRAT